MKLEYRNKPLTKDQKVKLVTDYAANMKVKDIMAKYDISRTTIYNILKTVIN
jgi:uncharacterized protein YjcR